MSKILTERCPRCGEILTFTEQATHLTCSACGHSFLVAEFIVRQLELEQAKSGKAEAEKKRAAAEAEKAALQARLNDTLTALGHIEGTQQAEAAKLQGILDGLQENRQSHQALTELLHAIQADGQDTLTRLMQAVMKAQSGAEEKLTSVEALAGRILQMQQADTLEARNIRRDLLEEIEQMQMDAAERGELADGFYDWSRRMRSEDVARLQSLQSAAGTLRDGQKALSDQISGVDEKISAATQAINAGFDQLQQQRLHELTQLYHAATGLQIERRFDEAEAKYRKLIEKGKEAQCAEVYWRMLLCHYGVEYQAEDDRVIPIILRPDLSEFGAKTVRKDLQEHFATPEQQQHYTERLEKIDFYLNRYRKVRQDPAWQYDVFISVKQNDKGRPTADSIAALKLYKRFVEDEKLARKKLRVFNSACVKLPAGEEFEPYIIQALLSSKVLIVVGSKPEYMEAQWVKNEWSRFQYLMETDKDTERVLFCYLTGGMSPHSIPRALNPNKQAIDEGPAAGDKLRDAIERVFPSDQAEPPEPSAETAESIIARMGLWLKLGYYQKVEDLFNELVDNRPELLTAPQLCLHVLCAQHQCRTLEQLAQKLPELRTTPLFELAYENADGALRKKLNALRPAAEPKPAAAASQPPTSASGKNKVKLETEEFSYEGEVRNGMPHGWGVAVFKEDNEFHDAGDRYEGEWKDGKEHGHGMMTYADLGKYDGEWLGGFEHGHGVFSYDWGATYDGEWSDGLENGHGVYTYASGLRYEGEWESGDRHGYGVFHDVDGDSWEGEFDFARTGMLNLISYEGDKKNGVPHGKGAGVYSTGDRYVGEWKDGKKHGHGVLITSDANRYIGEFRDDYENGHGVITYDDGVKYDGNWKDGSYDGHGVLNERNGECYDGSFKQHFKCGHGVMTYANGNRYVGNWDYDALNGYGVMTYANGDKYVGNWSNDVRSGHGVMTCADGRRAEGEWKDDQLLNYGEKTFEIGKYSGELKDGIPHGHGLMLYNNGKRYEGEWVQGQAHGHGTLDYADGDKYVGELKNGELDGYGVLTRANGDKYDGMWIQGKGNGHAVFTWANGDQYDGEWKDGKRHGHGTMYYANGKKWEGEWENGHKAFKLTSLFKDIF